MTVDFLPSIKALCEARIRQLRPHLDADRIDELRLIIALCDGLQKQQEIFANATTVKEKEK